MGKDSQSAAQQVPDGAASPRALQELAETVQRSRLGGPFYVLAWIFAGLAGELPQRAPVAFVLVALAFVVLGGARLAVRPLPQHSAAGAVQRRLDAIWTVVLVNSATWGLAAGGLLWATADEGARTVTAISSYAFSTAFAHNFCMRRERALVAIGLLYLPTLGAYVASGARFEFVAISLFYLAYVVLALRRSHREYLQRLDLEDELRSQRDRFEQQSRRDGLTGLANRRHFGELLEDLVQQARVAPLPFVLVILDLDWFKAVNDRHGHAVGDACLRAFAERLQQAFAGRGEQVARLGGEEFAVLLRDCATNVAVERMDAFRRALAGQPLPVAGLAIGITASMGVGGFEPRLHGSAEALFHAVDAALYRAKAQGRNRVCEAAADGHPA